MMTYRLRSLLSVSLGLASVLGLGFYVYFGVYVAKKQEKREDLEARLVFSLRPADVQRLELSRSGGQSAVVERQADGGWRMIKPVEAEADPIEIGGLLTTFSSMTSTRLIPAENMGQYGLERPRVAWRITLADGRLMELKVGKASSYNQALYAWHSAAPDKVLVLEAYLAGQLLKNKLDLRQKRLLGLDSKLVGRIELETGGTRFLLAKEAGLWMLKQPVEDRADEQRVQRLLNVFGNLQATRFIDGERKLSTYGLESPLVKLRLAGLGEADWAYEFWLGKGGLKINEEKVFVSRRKPDGPVAELRAHVLGGMKVDVFALRAKNPVKFQAEKVQRIKISGPSRLLVLERGSGQHKEQAWNLVAPMPAPAKSYKVLSLLESLRRLKAKRFLGLPDEEKLSASGLDSPALSLSLVDKKGKEISTLKIGRQRDGGLAVLGSGRPEICLVDKGILDVLNQGIDELMVQKRTRKEDAEINP